MKSFTIALIALFACIGASLGYNYGYMPYTPTSGMGNNGLCKYIHYLLIFVLCFADCSTTLCPY